MALPHLGRDVFSRGEPAPLRVVTSITYDVSLYDLLTSYGQSRKSIPVSSLRIDPDELLSVDDALRRLSGLIGATPEWCMLMSFLPADLRDGLVWRSALASTLAATLELTRQGTLEMRQDGVFGPIYVKLVVEQRSERS